VKNRVFGDFPLNSWQKYSSVEPFNYLKDNNNLYSIFE